MDGSINTTYNNLLVEKEATDEIIKEVKHMYKLLKGHYMATMDSTLTNTIDNDFEDANKQLSSNENMVDKAIELDQEQLEKDLANTSVQGGMTDEARFARNERHTINKYVSMVKEVFSQ